MSVSVDKEDLVARLVRCDNNIISANGDIDFIQDDDEIRALRFLLSSLHIRIQQNLQVLDGYDSIPEDFQDEIERVVARIQEIATRLVQAVARIRARPGVER